MQAFFAKCFQPGPNPVKPISTHITNRRLRCNTSHNYQTSTPTGCPPQSTPNQVPMSHQYHQSLVQVPLAYIPTPIVNNPTTTSQTTTSHNNGQTLYVTYSDGDSVPNGDMDDESGNTHPWQAVVKKRKRNPQSNLIENPVPTTTHNT